MRILGIDYGSKRVGIAVSDETDTFASPLIVLPTSKNLTGDIKEICIEQDISKIIIGESKDYSGKDNPIMKEIVPFKTTLEKETGLPVLYEPEFMTSAAAEHIQGKTTMHDASAAALILQSFLDKQKNISK